jgi:cell division protein ZapB
MVKKTKPSIIDKEIDILEEQVESLLTTLKHLMDENRSLRAQQVNLASDRAGLIEKHDVVRARVEAIVTRLKSLETGA